MSLQRRDGDVPTYLLRPAEPWAASPVLALRYLAASTKLIEIFVCHAI